MEILEKRKVVLNNRKNKIVVVETHVISLVKFM